MPSSSATNEALPLASVVMETVLPEGLVTVISMPFSSLVFVGSMAVRMTSFPTTTVESTMRDTGIAFPAAGAAEVAVTVDAMADTWAPVNTFARV